LWDTYTTTGTAQRTWHPRFSYHGFRYLELKGLPEGAEVSVRGLVLHTDNASAGEFTSGSELLNGIHSLIRGAIQGNMMSVLTDCPSREKLGWLEQDQLVFPALAANYDMQSQLRKIVRDMADAQTPDGLIPSTVPDYTLLPGAYRNDANWGGAFVLVPWQLYTTYGDQETLRTYYPRMKEYAAFLERQVADGILDYGLGDWITPDRTFPRAVAGTYGYWRVVDALGRIAGVLGEREDAAAYREKADASVAALSAKYYDATTGTFGGGGHGAEALALDMGAVPDGQRQRLLDHFVHSVEQAGDHLVLGEISLPAAFRVLSAAGRDDVVYRIATRTDSPSYGYQVQHGNTTLGETWDGGSGQSQNHFMLGVIDGMRDRRMRDRLMRDNSGGPRRRTLLGLTAAAGAAAVLPTTVTTAAARGTAPRPGFAAAFALPSRAVRPKFRWWWPDGLVDPAELAREVDQIADAGFGGVEIAAVTHSLSEPIDAERYGWGTAAWVAGLESALRQADRRGLTVDVTIGPAWPAAVPTVTPDSEAAASELAHGLNTFQGSYAGPVPPPVVPAAEGVTDRRLLWVQAARIGAAAAAPAPLQLDLDSVTDLTALVRDGELRWTAPDDGQWALISYWERGSGQRPEGPAHTAPLAYVVDHFSTAGTRAVTDFWERRILTRRVRELLRRAGGALFEDSLEIETDATLWTPGLADEFE
ncbi:family 78 glycoside hydrolase catalytic domain, partial [Streptomyces sp. MCAF7]